MNYILVADDDDSVKEIISNALINAGYDCKTIGSPGSIVEVVQEIVENQQFIELVILDYDFQGPTGLDVIEVLREEQVDSDFLDNTFLILTGNNDQVMHDAFTSLGAVHCLVKPIDEKNLIASVRQQINRREYLNQKYDWEYAIKTLEKNNLLPNIQQITVDFDNLKSTYEQLLVEVEEYQKLNKSTQKIYEDALNKISSGRHLTNDLIALVLDGCGYTLDFINDIKQTYSTNKLYFIILIGMIGDYIHGEKDYPTKELHGAPGHYEWRVRRSHRVYFRRDHARLVFERFGHKNIQEKIICNLRDSIKESEDISYKIS